ncbi:unnamed protein product [Mycena citricolor]|uniref:Uncharacterized protein n=1 Tax=Mycena citricolor TaxID=2018698 RepID=A0AAD2GWE9_9AGAR|nr:unnamed protein product [Mycena citricolor]
MYEFPPRELFVAEANIGDVAPENRTQVVQPLVGAEDTFDVAVSVWLARTVEEQEYIFDSEDWDDAGRSLSAEQLVGPDAAANMTVWEKSLVLMTHRNFLDGYHDAISSEKVVFSDAVFRDVRMSDTNLHAEVPLQIPTEIFHEMQGNNNVLRASFVVIPKSPLLPYYKHFTSWYPHDFLRPQLKSFPFPLNSTEHTYHRPIEQAFDSFGFTIPMVEYHSVAPICLSDDTSEIFNHPHIITRTHLRMVRETRLFNASLYTGLHESLQSTACGHYPESEAWHVTRCHERRYIHNVNYETRLWFAVPSGDGNETTREESAYAPFMDVLQSSAGPRDVVPVPINRETCAEAVRASQETMNITWRLSFGTLSPRRFLLSDLDILPSQRSDHTDSDFSRAMKQETTELFGVVYGHRHGPESSAGFRLLRFTISLISNSLLFFLACIYWFTRPTSAFISIPGTLLIVSGELCACVFGIYYILTQSTGKDPGVDVSFIVYSLIGNLPSTILILRAISPLKLAWTFTGPRIRWVKRTHQERASARLDAGWLWRVSLFAALTLVYWAFDFQHTYIFEPALFARNEHDTTGRLSDNAATLADALIITGTVSQLALNHRSGVFAGRYRVAQILALVSELLKQISAVPQPGTQHSTLSLSYAELVWNAVLVVGAWQACVMSSRIPEDDGMDE